MCNLTPILNRPVKFELKDGEHKELLCDIIDKSTYIFGTYESKISYDRFRHPNILYEFPTLQSDDFLIYIDYILRNEEFQLATENIESLIKVDVEIKIDNLENNLIEWQKAEENRDSLICLFDLIEQNVYKRLYLETKKNIQEHFKYLNKKDCFNVLPIKRLVDIFDSDFMAKNNVNEAFPIVEKWAKFSLDGRKDELLSFTTHLDYIFHPFRQFLVENVGAIDNTMALVSLNLDNLSIGNAEKIDYLRANDIKDIKLLTINDIVNEFREFEESTVLPNTDQSLDETCKKQETNVQLETEKDIVKVPTIKDGLFAKDAIEFMEFGKRKFKWDKVTENQNILISNILNITENIYLLGFPNTGKTSALILAMGLYFERNPDAIKRNIKYTTFTNSGIVQLQINANAKVLYVTETRKETDDAEGMFKLAMKDDVSVIKITDQVNVLEMTEAIINADVLILPCSSLNKIFELPYRMHFPNAKYFAYDGTRTVSYENLRNNLKVFVTYYVDQLNCQKLCIGKNTNIEENGAFVRDLFGNDYYQILF